jgi:hypothetical protein
MVPHPGEHQVQVDQETKQEWAVVRRGGEVFSNLSRSISYRQHAKQG